MLDLEPELLEALMDSHQPGWAASSFYGPTQTLPDVPMTVDGSLTLDTSGTIHGNGAIFLAKTGESLVPKSKTDALAPYGQELALVHTVSKSGKTWSVPMGRYRIQKLPSMKEYFRRWPDRIESTAWSARLNIVDRFDIIQADDFRATETAPSGSTAYGELQRLSPVPIVVDTVALPDRTMPSAVVYTSRRGAIDQIATVLGGVAYLTREGALTIRRANRWLTDTEPDFTLEGVIDMDDSMSNDLYNSVVITCPSDEKILGQAEIADESDPLAVTRPIGRRTYSDSNPLMDTQAKADAAAVTALARLSTQQSRVVTVTCPVLPQLELGDFGLAKDPVSGRQVLGEISKLSYQLDPTQPMTMELTVAEVR